MTPAPVPRSPGVGALCPLKAALMATLVSCTLLARFGLNFGAYSLDLGFVGICLLLAVMAGTGRLRVDPVALTLYAASASVAIAGFLVNLNLAPADRSSLSSLLLLLALYLPLGFVVHADADTADLGRWAMRAFGNVALICGIAGIAQFYAQRFLHAPWLFDFSPLIPAPLQGASGYNTVIPVGAQHKSNGFFLREPSGFSFLMALALLGEVLLFRRVLRAAVFVLGLLLSYSGTGLLALLIALAFPLGARTAVRLLLVGLAGAVVLGTLGEALNLSFTVDRVNEFGHERSSAYIRYIAPMRVVLDSIDTSAWTMLLGHGAGTIQRTAHRIESFDPTWAKLLFEYGILGFACFVALVGRCVGGSGAPAQIRAALFFCWLLMGGHLLSPQNVALLVALSCLWRGGAATPRAETPSRWLSAPPMFPGLAPPRAS